MLYIVLLCLFASQMSPRVIWVCKKNIWERIYNVSYTIFALEFFILFTTFIMGFAKKTLMIAVVLLTAVSSETMAKWEHRSTEAANLLRYMEDNVGKKMLTGVHASVNYNTYEADWVYSHTGKYPAINCMDFIHDVYSHSGGWIDYGNPNIALSWVNNGGIMAAVWHWGMPTNDGSTYTCTPGTASGETSFRPSAVFNKTSDGYRQMISRIDQISNWMKPLADRNIPIIWRPLHEGQGNWSEQYPNQGWHKAWFWWGIDGPEAFVELWKVMYDRMVNYHGLKNLIWVLNVGDSKRWYPGDEYVDIVAYDCYNQDMNGMRNIYWMIRRDYPDKLCAISEFGNIPYVSSLWADGQYWSFLIPWWDNARTSQPGSWAFNSTDHNNANVDYWNNAFACDFIITRDELPNLSNYSGGEGGSGGYQVVERPIWKVLYDGGDVPMGGWTGFINTMGPDLFNDVLEGDVVRVYIKDKTGGWQQGAFKNGSTWEGLTEELGVVGLTDYNFATGYYEMTFDAATLAQVKANGLIISGCNYTATKVVLLKNETVLYGGGAVAMKDWSGYINTMGAELFANASVGDNIRVYIKDKTGDWQQGSFKNGSNWVGLTEELGVIGLTDDDFSRGYYEMTIDEATLSQLQSTGLIVSGCNYTANKVVLIKNAQPDNGTATGIQQTMVNMKDDRYYDLSGRQLSRPQNGIIIINSKKIVIK